MFKKKNKTHNMPAVTPAIPRVISETKPISPEVVKDMTVAKMPVPNAPGEYTPHTLDMHDRSWRNNVDYLKDLAVLAEAVEPDAIHADSGYCIGRGGKIELVSDNGTQLPGVICGMAVASAFDGKEAGFIDLPVAIINTEDAGFRYVNPNQNGSYTDIGPVDHACIVGNVNRAEGLYVPLNNLKAMADGKAMLTNMIDNAHKAGEMDHPRESIGIGARCMCDFCDPENCDHYGE